MKRILCAILSASLLLGIVSCTTKETTDTTPIEEPPTTESTTETSVSTEPSVLNEDGLDMSITDVARCILNVLGSEYEVAEFASEKNKDENEKLGVLNYLRIKEKNLQIDQNIGEFDGYSIDIFIVEFDMQSDLYKSISEGKSFMFFEGGGKTKLTATAINKQFVISIKAGLGKEGKYAEENAQFAAPFTIGNAQQAYDAFMALNSDPADISKVTLAEVTKQVFNGLGKGYKISDVAHKFREEENKKLGVLNYILINRVDNDLDNKIDNFDSCSVDFYIFEFDTTSTVYKSLVAGSEFTFFEGAVKEKKQVTAIKDQYVISVTVRYGKDGNYSSSNSETQPTFKFESAQKGYEAFIALKEPEPKNPYAVQMGLGDIMFSLVDTIGNYNSFRFADERDVKANSSNEILDALKIRIMDGVQGDYTLVDIFVLEYDLDSEVLWNLSAGDKITVSVCGTTYDLIVAAINKQYVLCETVYVVKGSEVIDKELEPLFKNEYAKNVYYAFKRFR